MVSRECGLTLNRNLLLTALTLTVVGSGMY